MKRIIKPDWYDPGYNAETDGGPQCGCHKCSSIERRMIMILCPLCGNKRCPHATDHNLACTDSNQPGQKGSIYDPDYYK